LLQESLKADCEVYNSEFVELLRAKNTALDAYVDSLEKELASFQSAILSPEQYGISLFVVGKNNSNNKFLF
jgi:hypothetical protein